MHRILPTRWGLNLFEGLIVLALLVGLCYGIHHLWPDSGVAQAIHAVFHIFTVVVQAGVGVLQALAGLLSQV
jgi:F0F1-type ATP synthase membrane subunit a